MMELSKPQALSEQARQVLSMNERGACTKLVVSEPGDQPVADLLARLGPRDVLKTSCRDDEAAACLLAGLWLWHDFLIDSHNVSQGIDTPDGGYWHAIMHRREGDFANAKYWYRQAGEHPVFAKLGDGFDPYAFVDRVEKAHADPGGDDYAPASQLQRREWQALFNHCLDKAAGEAL